MTSAQPMLSIIVVAYKMPGQLAMTLETLAPDYQRGVSEQDYEVIVMENSSVENLPQKVVASLPGNFRYVLREESSQTPVYAINEGFKLCRGKAICLMIDGARMVTPGVVATSLQALRLNPNAIIAVPGYHLGDDEQHLLDASGDLRAQELELLAEVDWRNDGYQLFGISTLSGANRNGYLQPIMECNCLVASAENYRKIGYADERFTLPGGGSINLHIYRSLGMLPGTDLYVTPGEGSFHQYHGGVTTSSYRQREKDIEEHRVQLHSLWPEGFNSLRRSPKLLGEVPAQALQFLQLSAERAQTRAQRLASQGSALWPDDEALAENLRRDL